MDRRIAAVGFVVLLLSAVVAIQVLDPQFDEREPPEVDFSEPPAEVAADAAKQFEYVDYAYRLDLAEERDGEWKQVRVMQVDHSDREYYKAGPIGDRGVVLYGTDSITFVRPGSDAQWRVIAVAETAYPASTISQPISTDSIEKADASIVKSNTSYVVIHIASNPLKIVGKYPGTAQVLLNKESGLMESAVVEYSPEQSTTKYLRFQMTETNASVERPEDIPFSAKEVVWDVFRGPIFSF